MTRDQLEHAIRASCAIIGQDKVLIIGSQSILGTWDETQLPTNGYTGLCLDPLDGCAAKVAAFREKDRVYVKALVDHGLIDPDDLICRVRMCHLDKEHEAIVTGWVRGLVSQ